MDQLQFPFMAQVNLESYLRKEIEEIKKYQRLHGFPTLESAAISYTVFSCNEIFRRENFNHYFKDSHLYNYDRTR